MAAPGAGAVVGPSLGSVPWCRHSRTFWEPPAWGHDRSWLHGDASSHDVEQLRIGADALGETGRVEEGSGRTLQRLESVGIAGQSKSQIESERKR